MIGTSPSHYQITAKLGEGGMGAAKDRERLSRFERQARALAALSHANFAHVYHFDESDGTHFLVTHIIRFPCQSLQKD